MNLSSIFQELWIFEMDCPISVQISAIVSIFVQRRPGENFLKFLCRLRILFTNFMPTFVNFGCLFCEW